MNTIKFQIPQHKSKCIFQVPINATIAYVNDQFIWFDYSLKDQTDIEIRYFSLFSDMDPLNHNYITETSFEKDGKTWYLCEEPTKTIICTK